MPLMLSILTLHSVIAPSSPLLVKCPGVALCTYYVPTNPGQGHEVCISVVQSVCHL